MKTTPLLVFALFACGLFAQTPAPAVKKAVPPPATSTPVTTGFVGNRAAMVFHLPTCKLVLKIKPENKVIFATKEEALRAGYTPCRICLQ
jgi:hypothetical protein